MTRKYRRGFIVPAYSVESGAVDSLSANGAERRVHCRLQAAELRGLVTARFRYGNDVRLIDLSTGGALVEVFGELVLNSNVVLELSGPASTLLVPSRTLRIDSLAHRDDSGRCEAAFAFRRNVQLTGLLEQPPAAWHKIVAHCLDGRTLRGYTYDFRPTKRVLSISPSPFAEASRQVPITGLDSILFLRNGAAEGPASVPVATRAIGRRVAITLPDGVVLAGTVFNDHRDGAGTYIQPADMTNIVRIFLTPQATRNLKYL